MNLRSSPIVGLVAAIVIIVGAVFAFKGCGKSPSSALESNKVRQRCLACGHEWRMTSKSRLEEARKDPSGHRFTRCPKCGEWRGAALIKCPECGELMPNIIIEELEDGTIITRERVLCDECAKKHGGQPVEDEEGQ
jgi:uncharacterized protein with PIN domain